MSGKLKRITSLMMAALMVVCGLQITPMTAKAAENEKTYTFAQMTKLMEWGVTSSVDEDGVLSLDYSGQYKSCFYGIPSDLDFSKVEKVIFNLTEGTAGDLAFKLHTQADMDTDNKGGTPVSYGNPQITPEDTDIVAISIMSTGAAPSAKLSGVTFKLKEQQGGGEQGNVDPANKTYTFAQLTKVNGWGETDSVNENGALEIAYSGQYQSIFFAVPSDLDFSKVDKVTFNVSSGATANMAFKLHTAEDYASDNKGGTPVSYGNPVITPEVQNIEYFSMMSTTADASAVIDSVTFHVNEAAGGGQQNLPTTAVSYNFLQMEKRNSYNVSLTVGQGGALTLDYSAQYAESMYNLPAEIDGSKLKKVIFNVESGNAGNLAFKTYDAAGQQVKVEYGNPTVNVVTDDVAGFGIMSLPADPFSAQVSSVTFVVEGDAEVVKTVNMADFEVAKNGGPVVTPKGDSAEIACSGQYQEVFFALPKVIDSAKLLSFTLDGVSSNMGDFAVKLYSEADFGGNWPSAKNENVFYGNAEIQKDSFEGIKYMGIMSLREAGGTLSVDSITFHTLGWGYADEIKQDEVEMGDNIIKNPNFANADVSDWTLTQGDAIITAETADTAIVDDIKTYGKITGRTAPSECFAQDITDSVQKGKTYAYSFYAKLSDDYADAPAEQRQVDFAPYIVSGSDTSYLGSYSSELTGSCSQKLTVGQWTKFEGTFKVTAAGDIDRVVIRLLEQGTNYGQGDCVKGEYYVTAVSMKEIIEEAKEIEQDIPNWKDAITKDLGAGTIAATSVMASEMGDDVLMELVKKHFNAVTFGNELKPDAVFGYNNSAVGATETVTFNGTELLVPALDFSRAERMLDVIYNWNAEHPEDFIKVRGHVLVWHSQTPEWFYHVDYDKSKDYVTPEVMNLRLEWYIKTVLQHFTGADSKYKDMFYGWDVVNEAVSDNSSRVYRTDKENGTSLLAEDTHGSNSGWWKVYGSNEFIIKAFQYANKYAPASLELYYNDYNDCVPSKVNDIVTLLNDVLSADGTRISAMGMQGHHEMASPTIAQFESAVRAYAAVVGKVQITELDIKASSQYDGTAATLADEYTRQAYRYKDFYDMMKKLDAEDGIEVSGITMWGVIDGNSWLQSFSGVGGGASGNRKQCPLLFDDDYKAKPSFWAFVDPDRLEPAIQNTEVVFGEKNQFVNGNQYAFSKGDTTATVTPIWNGKTVQFFVNVKDSTVDAADAVTVYVDEANSRGAVTPKKATVKRSDVIGGSAGYTATVEITLNQAINVTDTIAFDVVVTDGTTKIAFNDKSGAYETSSKYYANATFKPYAEVVKGTATIDGVEEAAWANAKEIPLSISLGAKATATAKLLWDDTYLYVYAKIQDADLNNASANEYEQDSLEVFIDENNHKTESYEADDKQYRISYVNDHSFNGTKCLEENVASATKLVTGGYVVEAAYKWTDIQPKVNDMIGLELQINDADSTGRRIGTLSWFDASGMGYASTAVYGSVKLVAGAATAAPTVADLVEDANKLTDALANGTVEEQKAACEQVVDVVKELVKTNDVAPEVKATIKNAEAAIKAAVGQDVVIPQAPASTGIVIKGVDGALLSALSQVGDLQGVPVSFVGTEVASKPNVGSAYANASFIDLKLVVGTNNTQIEPQVPLTVRVQVPANIDTNKPVKVLHYLNGVNAAPEVLDATIAGGALEFTTRSLSPFAIVNEDDQTDDGDDDGDDNQNQPAATTPKKPGKGGAKAPGTWDDSDDALEALSADKAAIAGREPAVEAAELAEKTLEMTADEVIIAEAPAAVVSAKSNAVKVVLFIATAVVLAVGAVTMIYRKKKDEI